MPRKKEYLIMFEKIAAMLADHVDIPVEEVTLDTTFESLGIDSLDTVEMVMELGDDLGVELELDEKIATVGELVTVLEKQVNG
jgi:acyl carrier protein